MQCGRRGGGGGSERCCSPGAEGAPRLREERCRARARWARVDSVAGEGRAGPGLSSDSPVASCRLFPAGAAPW